MDAKEGGGGAAQKPERETRCYALTGTAKALDAAERILQKLEQAGEAREKRRLLLVWDGLQNDVLLRTLATWIEEEG